MRLSEVAENAKEGDIITENDEVLKDIGMDAIDRLRFRVLIQKRTVETDLTCCCLISCGESFVSDICMLNYDYPQLLEKHCSGIGLVDKVCYLSKPQKIRIPLLKETLLVSSKYWCNC